MFKNFLGGLAHVLAPLRYVVFLSLGCIVMLSLNQCTPESNDTENPLSQVGKSY